MESVDCVAVAVGLVGQEVLTYAELRRASASTSGFLILVLSLQGLIYLFARTNVHRRLHWIFNDVEAVAKFLTS